MKTFPLMLTVALVLSIPAVAQDLIIADAAVDAGTPEVAVVDAGLPAAAVVETPAATPDEAPLMKVVFKAVSTGDWWGAASALLVLAVTLIRKYGRQLHELIPDNNPVDKIFWFLLETKPGGWLLNLLTTIAGGVGSALLAGEAVTWALVKPVLIVSITGASLWELVKDVGEFVESKKQAEAK